MDGWITGAATSTESVARGRGERERERARNAMVKEIKNSTCARALDRLLRDETFGQRMTAFDFRKIFRSHGERDDGWMLCDQTLPKRSRTDAFDARCLSLRGTCDDEDDDDTPGARSARNGMTDDENDLIEMNSLLHRRRLRRRSDHGDDCEEVPGY